MVGPAVPSLSVPSGSTVSSSTKYVPEAIASVARDATWNFAYRPGVTLFELSGLTTTAADVVVGSTASHDTVRVSNGAVSCVNFVMLVLDPARDEAAAAFTTLRSPTVSLP